MFFIIEIAVIEITKILTLQFNLYIDKAKTNSYETFLYSYSSNYFGIL